LTEVLNETEAGKVFRDRYPDVAAVAGKIEGNLRTVGVHAAGVIVSSVPIVEVAPVETMAIRGGPRVPVVALDMRAAEAVGLVKIDVLPLKTLTVLAKAEQLSGVLCETIDPEDPDTLQAFTDQRFVGVFQFDSAGSRRICQGFMFRQFSDIAAITALNRPGPMETGMARIYVERSNGTARVESVHPIYDEVFKDTYGVPIYQEQVINLAKAVGYTPEEADKFRKKIAKKIGLADERPKFVAGAVAAGMDDDLAERIFNDLLGFASYAFNASHSYAYSCIAQWTMWYKVHHPAAFYAALLAVEDSETTQLRIAADARRSGIRVEPPDLQTSEARFALRVDPTGAPVIVGSTADLHGVGPATAKAIADNAPYTDLLDLYRRTAGRGIRVTSATFRILAASTALRSLCPGVPIRLLVENAKPIWESLRRGVLPVFNVPSPIPDYDPEALTKIASEVYPIYVDAKGHSAVDDVVDRLRRSCSRSILTPSEVDQTSPWIGFVAGLFTRIKLFPGESGKTGMAVIGSTDGSEIVARIDTDVLDACSRVLATVNQIVVAAVSVSDRGRIGLESIWPVEEILTPGSDPLRRFVAAPPRTTPRDPRLTIQKLDEDQKTWIEGIVIRIRKGKDKNGGNLRSLTIVGERGAIKVMVFASRLHRDITSIEVGQFVEMRVQKMRGDLVFLSEAEIKTVSDPWGANP
jgi:DNA polymerase III alpha subunit